MYLKFLAIEIIKMRGAFIISVQKLYILSFHIQFFLVANIHLRGSLLTMQWQQFLFIACQPPNAFTNYFSYEVS